MAQPTYPRSKFPTDHPVRATTVTPLCLDGFVTTFNELLFELRCWGTDRLRDERDRVIREQRKLRARELALTRVLDERDALAKDQAARDGETEAQSRRKRDTAKKLEELPNLGSAAMNGELSQGQLDPAADLADEESDEEITERAKRTSPLELQKLARERRRAQEREKARRNSVRRRNARSLRKWVEDGFLCGHFELPMEHGGAVVEAFFDQVTARMKPATGEAWEPLDRRQADVLIALCQMEAAEGRHEDDRAQEATVGARVDLHVDISLDGEATMCGVPLPDEWVEAARANARVHLRVVDDDGTVLAEDRARTFVSQKRRRAVVRRDGRCRWPGCNRRLRLQVHHLHPSSWGGGDETSNLASVCAYHHGLLIPHGDYVLDGNPNRPDGLTLRLVTAEERRRRRLEPMTLAV